MSKKQYYIDLICENCNSLYTINKSTLWARKKKNIKNLCKKCKELEHGKKMNNYFNNSSKEELEKRNEKISLTMRKKLNKLSKEENSLRMKETYKGRDNWYKNKPNEVNDRNNKISIKNKNNWKFMSNNTRNQWEFNHNTSTQSKEFRKNMSKIKKEEWCNKSEKDKEKNNSMLRKEYNNWNRYITPEERIIHNKNISLGNKEYWNNINVEEYHQQCLQTAIKFNNDPNNHIPVTNTESIFHNNLNKYNINHICQYYNIIKHKDFDSIFPINLATNSKVINPYHIWDFIIYTKQGNILVDVDGSEHVIPEGTFIAKNRNHDVGAKVQFNDSQRPYQTDNMDAYIIECYNDKLEDDTKVLDLKSNKYISYKEFINMIQLMNYNDKELREIL